MFYPCLSINWWCSMQVVDGVEEGVARMLQGGVRRLTVPHHLAYGADGE